MKKPKESSDQQNISVFNHEYKFSSEFWLAQWSKIKHD
jgi:hypothetical protein